MRYLHQFTSRPAKSCKFWPSGLPATILVVTAFALTTFAGPVQAQFHGAQIQKLCTTAVRNCVDADDCSDGNLCTEDICDTTLPRTTNCNIRATNSDDFGDSVTVTAAFDEITTAGGVVRIPVAGNMLVSAVSGDVTCNVGDALPCTLNTIDSWVEFNSQYTLTDADSALSSLPDQTTVTNNDNCDDPDTTGCSTADNTVQATASTTVEDACSNGPVDSCDDSNACTADSCDPATGSCSNVDDFDCDDVDECTDDSCDPATGECVNIDNGICGEVRFHVTKIFSDGSEDVISAHLSCNDGIPSSDWAPVTGGDPAGHTFIVQAFADGEMDCEITETGGPDGYEVSPDSCVFEDVTGLESPYECEFYNDALPGEYTVTKEWVINNEGGDFIREDVRVTIACDRRIFNKGAEQIKGTWFLSRRLGDGESMTASVRTERRPNRCMAEERITQSGVESESEGNCDWHLIGAGESSYCTFINTVFFEGIPTLSQYGLAILALLMLGLGAIGFRRFV